MKGLFEFVTVIGAMALAGIAWCLYAAFCIGILGAVLAVAAFGLGFIATIIGGLLGVF